MWFVKNPEWFDVIVTDNMFGDIITDLGAMIQGGMGIAAGGNINPKGVSMFEPIGGSAPQYTGKNVINPLAAVCGGGPDVPPLGGAAGGREGSERAVHVRVARPVRTGPVARQRRRGEDARARGGAVQDPRRRILVHV